MSIIPERPAAVDAAAVDAAAVDAAAELKRRMSRVRGIVYRMLRGQDTLAYVEGLGRYGSCRAFGTSSDRDDMRGDGYLSLLTVAESPPPPGTKPETHLDHCIWRAIRAGLRRMRNWPRSNKPKRSPKKVIRQPSFAVRLNQLRYERGMSRWELAARAGLNADDVFNWEVGSAAPSWDNVVALADALSHPVASGRPSCWLLPRDFLLLRWEVSTAAPTWEQAVALADALSHLKPPYPPACWLLPWEFLPEPKEPKTTEHLGDMEKEHADLDELGARGLDRMPYIDAESDPARIAEERELFRARPPWIFRDLKRVPDWLGERLRTDPSAVARCVSDPALTDRWRDFYRSSDIRTWSAWVTYYKLGWSQDEVAKALGFKHRSSAGREIAAGDKILCNIAASCGLQ